MNTFPQTFVEFTIFTKVSSIYCLFYVRAKLLHSDEGYTQLGPSVSPNNATLQIMANELNKVKYFFFFPHKKVFTNIKIKK